jgi:hypothetical protein
MLMKPLLTAFSYFWGGFFYYFFIRTNCFFLAEQCLCIRIRNLLARSDSDPGKSFRIWFWSRIRG